MKVVGFGAEVSPAASGLLGWLPALGPDRPAAGLLGLENKEAVLGRAEPSGTRVRRLEELAASWRCTRGTGGEGGLG